MSDRLSPRALGIAVVTAACSSCGVVLIKSGVAPATPLWMPLLAGLVVYGVGIVLGMILMGRYALSLVYPVVVGLSLTVLALISVLLLGESMTPHKATGTALILVGVALLVGKPRNRVESRG
ncbi:MAG: hypothetical protein ABIT36_06960 [Steroidobacteraceae bacterium]